MMWSRVQTQWRTSMSGVIGLDYGAIAWVFRLYEVKDQRSLLEDLQVMEAAAMAKLNERSS
jgi:ABC-type thiamine transport system substrate-binding protein